MCMQRVESVSARGRSPTHSKPRRLHSSAQLAVYCAANEWAFIGSQLPPRLRVGRGAEDAEVIFLGIAALAVVLLEDSQHILETHDSFDFDEALLAESGSE